jgi:hypothetical protein
MILHVKDPYSMKEITVGKISRQVSPVLLVGVSAAYCQRALVDKAGIIRTQMGSPNRSEMVAVQGSLCNSNGALEKQS